MIPVKFPKANCTFAEGQDEYQNLPAHKTGNGIVISCWEMTFWEWLIFLSTGKIYLRLWVFNKPLTPSLLEVKSPFVKEVKDGLETKTKNKGG